MGLAGTLSGRRAPREKLMVQGGKRCSPHRLSGSRALTIASPGSRHALRISYLRFVWNTYSNDTPSISFFLTDRFGVFWVWQARSRGGGHRSRSSRTSPRRRRSVPRSFPAPSLSLALSLALSPSLTHTHTHIRTNCFLCALSFSLSLSLSLLSFPLPLPLHLSHTHHEAQRFSVKGVRRPILNLVSSSRPEKLTFLYHEPSAST